MLLGIAGCDSFATDLLWESDETEQIPTISYTTVDSSVSPETDETGINIDENGQYTHRDDVALYLYTYGHLPYNYITKKEAKELGWRSGSLDEYIDGGCIGGDRFGNYEELLPKERGRIYYECDIDTMHQDSRGVKRIVYSNDGLIYYTEDHYSSYTLLYGEP